MWRRYDTFFLYRLNDFGSYYIILWSHFVPASVQCYFCVVLQVCKAPIFICVINISLGTTRKGFELMRKDLLPPSELDAALTGPENAKAGLIGNREPVVRHITTQNDADNSRGVGKAYPVSHFHWNGMTFVTFREPAVELSEIEEFKDTLFSRVAKVCDADKGRGVRYFSHRYWTSYAKARLICSSQPQGSGNSPGTAGTAPEFLFNEIQGTHVFQMSGDESSEDWRGEGLMVGIFDTPYTEMRTSAICIYDFGSECTFCSIRLLT